MIRVFSRHPWLAPTILFAILVLIGSFMHPLWGDEAETALFARNIVHYGIPRGWDGVNIMGLNDAVVLDKNLINHTSPWLQYYLAAESFLLFGQSSFTARLPFILASFGILPALYVLVKKITESRQVAFLTVFMASLSVPLILFSYQARYYSVTLISGIVFLYAALSLLEKRVLPKVLFIIAGIIFFYANYVEFTVFYISALSVSVLYFYLHDRSIKQIKQFLFWVAGLSAIIALFCLPWFIVEKPFADRGVAGLTPNILDPAFSPTLIQGLLFYNQNNAFPVLLIIVLLCVLFLSRRKKIDLKPLLFGLLLPFLFIFIMNCITYISTSGLLFTQVRYTMVIFPYFLFASAFLLSTVFHWKKPVGVVLIILFIFTNLLTLNPPRSFLFEFFGEAAHPYPTPDKLVADYLAKHAKDGDTAFVSLDRDHEPLEFYLYNKIRFVNRVSIINPRLFPENRNVLPDYLYAFDGQPDWVILFGLPRADVSFLTDDFRPLPPDINLSKDYTEHIIPVYFSDMSRPEIFFRSFTEIKPVYCDQVFVYHRKGE